MLNYKTATVIYWNAINFQNTFNYVILTQIYLGEMSGFRDGAENM